MVFTRRVIFQSPVDDIFGRPGEFHLSVLYIAACNHDMRQHLDMVVKFGLPLVRRRFITYHLGIPLLWVLG